MPRAKSVSLPNGRSRGANKYGGDDIMQILIFGDSIAYGRNDPEGGWVTRLRKFIDAKMDAPDSGTYYRELYNLGIPGETTQGTLERFAVEAAARIDEGGECTIIFAIGANDSAYFVEGGRNVVPIEDFERNLRELAAKAQSYNARVVFIGTIIADDSKVNPIQWAPTKAVSTEARRRYGAVIRGLANKLSVGFIDVETPFIAAGGTILIGDGVHPTSDGHRVIYETVRDALVAMNLI